MLASVSASAPRPTNSRSAPTTASKAATGAEMISCPGTRSHTATTRSPAFDRRGLPATCTTTRARAVPIAASEQSQPHAASADTRWRRHTMRSVRSVRSR